MKNEKIKKIINKLNEVQQDLSQQICNLECMDDNNEFGTYLEDYMLIRDSEEYLWGSQIRVLNNIEDIVISDMKEEDKVNTLNTLYLKTEIADYERYKELVKLVNIDTILELIDVDKCLIGKYK